MVFWISLAVLLVAVVAGIAYCVVRGLQLYRNAKRASGRITAEMERISEVTLEIERQSAKAAAAAERLQRCNGAARALARAARRAARRGARGAGAAAPHVLVRPGHLSGAPASRPARNLHVSPTRSASEAPKLTA